MEKDHRNLSGGGKQLEVEEGLPDDSSKALPLKIAEIKTQVEPQPKRRRFNRKYKLKILEELDACDQLNQKGAILRREGLYSSTVAGWRNQRAAGRLEMDGKSSKANEAMVRKIRDLERENAKLKKKLNCAEAVIEIQKKISEILGLDNN